MLLYIGIVIGFIGLASIVAGVLAFLRNSKSAQNRWFLVLSVAVGLWTMANFIDSNVITPVWTEVFLKLDYALALFIAWSLFQFANVFPISSRGLHRDQVYSRRMLLLTLSLNVTLVALIAIDGVFKYALNNNELSVQYFWPFWVYGASLLFYFGYAFGKLVYKRVHVVDIDRAAINLLGGGAVIGLVSNVCTNLLFPNIFDNRTLIQGLNIIGYTGLLIFIICVYFGITTKRLFDIRPVVARSLGYALTLITVASIYGFLVFGTARLVFGLQVPIVVQILLSALTGAAALAFSSLKKQFDWLTKRLFYRDAYEPEELYSKLNRLLVSTFDLTILLKTVSRLLAEELKVGYVGIQLKEVVGRPQRFVGTNKTTMPLQDILALRKLAAHNMHGVIVTDMLEDKSGAEIKQILRRYDIAVLIHLRSRAKHDADGLGYLMIGPKRSGNMYTAQDLRVLTTVGNELTIAIQNALHFEEIQNFNETLQQKVVEATNKLRRTNEKLKEMDETKDDFISMASHQLRTPLTSVKGYLSMVLEGDAGTINKVQREMLGQAFFSSQRMVYLIADLLNVSRLKTGKFIIESTKVNLAEMVEQEMSQLIETASAKHLNLLYDKPADFPDTMLDETKTRQVVMNFMDNAIYYTPNDGNIQIKLTETSSAIEMRIIDNGIGVPKPEQHHLFTKFYRAANARKARPDGTGLGLFMAKKVISAQGGTVIFNSQEGQGSTFGFSFPKVALQASDKPATLK